MYDSVLGLKKPTFGLDIGYQTLKVMELRGSGAGAKLLGVTEIDISPKTLGKDGIKDKKQTAEAIVMAMRKAKPHAITARLISSALPESLVFTKSIDLPSMKIEEINKNIPYQASEFFPMPANEMYMDWQIVGSLPERNPTFSTATSKGRSTGRSIDVLVVAAPKVIINSLVETAKMAGLELASLETKPVADARALIPPRDPGPYILLDIGAKTSGIICFDRGIKLTSTITSSGDDLAENFSLHVKNLSNEIIHLIKYYQNRIGQATIFRKIILAGGGANIPDLISAMTEATRIKTEISWPIIQTKTYNPKFATVIGLAMKRI